MIIRFVVKDLNLAICASRVDVKPKIITSKNRIADLPDN